MHTTETGTPLLDGVIPVRRRKDLKATRVPVRGEPGWSVKDPVSLSYYRIEDPEYTILNHLDGRTTIRRLLVILQEQFPWEKFEAEDVQLYLKHLQACGLVTLILPGAGAQLASRAARLRRTRKLSAATSPIAIRFRGIDPTPILNHLYPIVRPLYSTIVLTLFSALACLAACLVCVRMEDILRHLPDLQTFVGPHNVVSLMLAILVIKLLHEFGHAMTCRHFGGECHELGILLLVFFPVFYCDVSDSWMLRSRRERMAISAAGIIVELILASTFVFLWWVTVPGWLNSFCLNAVIAGSVNTQVFNGNPLLKYDGYYVLSDLVDIPNLRQRSRDAVRQSFEQVVLGRSLDDSDSPPSLGLLAYGLASIAYSFFVIFAITWMVYQTCSAWQLSVLGRLLAISVLCGVILFPLLRLLLRFQMDLRNSRIRARRAVPGLLMLFGGLIALLTIPVTHNVSAGFVIGPSEAQPVYVTVPGTVVQSLPADTVVSSGDVIATLGNPYLRRERAKQAARVKELTIQLTGMERRRAADSTVAFRLPTTRDALNSAKEQLSRLDSELDRLSVTSPQDGTVLLPPNVSPSQLDILAREDTLNNWTGTPLDTQNQGAWLDAGTLLCSVGDSQKLKATLMVDQTDIEYIKLGQAVTLQLQSNPGELLSGTIEEIAQRDAGQLPREITAAGLAPQAGGRFSVSEAARVIFQVRVCVSTPEKAVGLYSPGMARIDCGRHSTAFVLWRQFRQTFSAL